MKGGGEVKRNGIKEVEKLIDETMQTMEERGFLKEDVERFVNRLSNRIEQNEKTLNDKQPFRVYKNDY